MAFDPLKRSLGRSRLIAIRDVVRSGVSTLNTALTDPNSQDFDCVDGLGPVDANLQVFNGDVETLWNIDTYGPLLFTISAGGYRDGLDFDTVIESVPYASKRNTLFTSVYCYIHPNAKPFKTKDVIEQARRRETARELLSDWLRNVLQPRDGSRTQIDLTSSDFDIAVPGNPDRLTRCMVVQGYKGYFSRGFQATEILYGIHFAHVGIIA